MNCVKSVRIRSYSGPHFPACRTEQLQIRTLLRSDEDPLLSSSLFVHLKLILQ